MRISLPVLLVLAACGGARTRGGGEAISGCDDYGAAVRPSLARIARAADLHAPGERGLAERLDEERSRLEALAIDDARLRRAHLDVVGALGAMARSLSFVADVRARGDESRRDEARARLADANRAWAAAVDGVRRVCPEM
jgi:hypothetical protein